MTVAIAATFRILETWQHTNLDGAIYALDGGLYVASHPDREDVACSTPDAAMVALTAKPTVPLIVGGVEGVTVDADEALGWHEVLPTYSHYDLGRGEAFTVAGMPVRVPDHLRRLGAEPLSTERQEIPSAAELLAMLSPKDEIAAECLRDGLGSEDCEETDDLEDKVDATLGEG